MSVKLSATELRLAADQCVKCAVCLPHCPTYALEPEEAESPRGRITLLQGIVYEKLTPTAQVHRHLDSCLSCGRCEEVCPANVPYTRLLDGGRFLMQRQSEGEPARVPRTQRLSAWLLSSPRLLKAMAILMKAASRARVYRLFGSSIIGRALRWMPASGTSFQAASSAAPVHLTATLFTGCLTDGFEQNVADSAIAVAGAYGIRLVPAPKGLCCGALYQHQGNEDKSSLLAARNLEALKNLDHPIVAPQSGCSRGLFDGLNYAQDAGAAATAKRITDLFVLLADSPGHVNVSASPDRVGVYAPCSTDKKSIAAMLKVLHRARPDIAVLGAGLGCCGAAGDHMVMRADRADQLAQPIVEEIIAARLTHVLVANSGCAWHLRANLSFRDHPVTIEHPLQWLTRHLAK